MGQKYIIFVLRMKTLYLFNPENDMALASGSPHYMPPASAKKMSADLAALPAWYADEGSDVLLPEHRQAEWMQKNVPLDLSVGWAFGLDAEYEKLSPWGWNHALVRGLREKGWQNDALCMAMDEVRALSSRKVAVELLPKLRVEGTAGESFWLDSVEELCRHASSGERMLLKAPWSGSGKGIQPLVGVPDENLCGWIRRIVRTQGGVVCEPYYNKVEDFAMEFHASAEGVSFVGYSLFEADARGIYKENWLATDEAIEERLSQYVAGKVLEDVRRGLLKELPLALKNVYQGYLGVDMMIVHTPSGYAVHPCVEINLRMNMGVVSRLFFDRHVCPQACGRYVIEYYPHEGDALAFHERMRAEHPARFHQGRLLEGYMSLTPVFHDTSYQIYVLVK